MPRYLIEREFPDGLNIPLDEFGAGVCRRVARVAGEGVLCLTPRSLPSVPHD